MASPDIQRGLDEVTQIIESAQRPGIGSTLKYLRICKALAPLRQLESRCFTETDLGQVKAHLLPVQVRLSICHSVHFRLPLQSVWLSTVFAGTA